MELCVHCINGNIRLPEYHSEGAAGADICAYLPYSVTINPGQRILIPTGLQFSIPEGFEIQVRPRSGLALKHGISILNTPGTIDSDYRGEVGVLLINQGEHPFIIEDGDRIAQIVVSPVVRAVFTLSKTLNSTGRGTGGYGSTGKN